MSNSERQYRVIQSLSEIVSNSEKQTSAMLSPERRELVIVQLCLK